MTSKRALMTWAHIENMSQLEEESQIIVYNHKIRRTFDDWRPPAHTTISIPSRFSCTTTQKEHYYEEDVTPIVKKRRTLAEIIGTLAPLGSDNHMILRNGRIISK